MYRITGTVSTLTIDHTQPPVAWRYCGNQLKRWRLQREVSREDLAREAGYSYEAIKSMEQGRRKPARRVLDIADDMCEAGGKLRAATDYLEPEKYPARTHEFMQAEASAIARHSYDVLVVPGLLQTQEYANALLNAHCPPLDDETVAERISARMQRQELIKNKPRTQFSFVIHEAALHNVVGDRSMMQEQFHHLLIAGELRNVTVQILTAGCGPHPGLNGPLVVLETEEHQHYTYVEGQETGMLYSDPGKVSALTQRHVMIRSLALTPDDSAQFIRKVTDER